MEGSNEPIVRLRPSDAEALFLSNLPLIEKLLASIARRQCFQDDEAEDFFAWAKLKLLEHDYRALSRFRGESRLSTFLTTVLLNLARDYRVHERGRWRPSAKARRDGEVAEQLETLLFRDGHSLDEAVEVLCLNYGVEESREELRALAAELPGHRPRRFAGEEEVGPLPSSERTDDRLLDAERQAQAQAAQEALAAALDKLPARDLVIVRLRFEDGQSVAMIARLLGANQRRLYSQFERILGALRSDLEDAGLRSDTVADLVGWEGWTGKIDSFEESRENEELGPSHGGGG